MIVAVPFNPPWHEIPVVVAVPDVAAGAPTPIEKRPIVQLVPVIVILFILCMPPVRFGIVNGFVENDWGLPLSSIYVPGALPVRPLIVIVALPSLLPGQDTGVITVEGDMEPADTFAVIADETQAPFVRVATMV